MQDSLRKLCLTIAILFAVPAASLACPMCKDALEAVSSDPSTTSPSAPNPIPLAYFTSILFMLGMMSTVTGSVVLLMWYVNQRETALLASQLAVEEAHGTGA